MQKTKGLKANWEKFFQISAYATLLLVPLIFWPGLLLDYELIKLVIFRSGVMLMLLFYSLWILQGGKVRVKNLFSNKGWGRLFFFSLLVAALSWVFATARDLSFWGSYFRMQGLYTQIHYLLFVVLLFLGFRSRKQWQTGMKMLIWGYTISLIYGLIQGFGLDPFGYDLQEESLGRVYSFLGHPNYFASYILLIFFPLLSISILKKKMWMYALCVLSMVVLLLTGSRAAFVGLLVGFSIVLISRYLCFKDRNSLITWLICLIVGGGALLTVNQLKDAEFISGNGFLIRLVIDEENMRSVDSRLLLWSAMPEHLQESLLLGYGQDSFGLSIANNIPEEINKYEEYGRMSDRAHNNLLQLLSDYGVLGLVVVIWLLILMLKEQRKCFSQWTKEQKLMVVGVNAAFAAVGAAHLFGFSVTAHYLVMTFYLGWMLSLFDYKAKSYKLNDSPWQKRILKGAVVFFCLSSILVENALYVYADHQAQKGFNAISDGDGGVVVSHLVEANLLNPNQDYYAYSLASVLSQLDEADAALVYLEKAGDFNNGEDYYYYYLKGKILSRNCEESCDLADASFARASVMAPSYAPNWLEWGKFLVDTGNCEDGVTKLEHYRDMLSEAWKKPGTEEYRLFYKHNPQFKDVAAYIGYCKQS